MLEVDGSAIWGRYISKILLGRDLPMAVSYSMGPRLYGNGKKLSRRNIWGELLGWGGSLRKSREEGNILAL